MCNWTYSNSTMVPPACQTLAGGSFLNFMEVCMDLKNLFIFESVANKLANPTSEILRKELGWVEQEVILYQQMSSYYRSIEEKMKSLIDQKDITSDAYLENRRIYADYKINQCVYVYGIPRKVYRYLKFNDKTIENLANNQLWFSNSRNFDDNKEGYNPFKGRFSDIDKHKFDLFVKCHYPDLLEKNGTNREHMYNILEGVYEELITTTRICCFTRSPYMMNMWDEYAEQGKGICICLDLLEDPEFSTIPFKVIYNKGGFWGPSFEICNEFPIERVFCTKTTKWEDQKEIRIIKQVDFMEHRNLVSYKPSALKSVFFGSNVLEKDVTRVKQILKGQNIEFYHQESP